MANEVTRRREDALHSALDRLDVPMIICDENQVLRPLNVRGTALFEAEHLTGDLLQARPSHPLSRLIDDIVGADESNDSVRRMVTFPSGKQYVVESSGRSRKGLQRWLVLVFQPFRAATVDAESALQRWPFTDREREVAARIVRGMSNQAIAAEMGVSPETIKTHVRSIFEKSATHSRNEFLAAVLRTR